MALNREQDFEELFGIEEISICLSLSLNKDSVNSVVKIK